jgi:ribosomal protein S18 acetylase RimI-like enzyme
MFTFRPLVPADQDRLWHWLHVALWDPPPAPLRPVEVLQSEGARIYAEDWGRDSDVGVVLQVDGVDAGACWMRLVPGRKGLGYVDDATPQLGIALEPEFQHRGFGRALMTRALVAAREHGYAQVSLTVHPQNPAQHMYAKCGFREVDRRNTYLLMVCALDRFTGGCLCGDVRFVATGRPYRVGLCHCMDCRKHHGALFHASAIFPQDAVTIEGEARAYASRFFCARCGSSVFARSGDEVEVYLGALDSPGLFTPTYESWVIRRDRWLPPFPFTRHYERDRPATGRSESDDA